MRGTNIHASYVMSMGDGWSTIHYLSRPNNRKKLANIVNLFFSLANLASHVLPQTFLDSIIEQVYYFQNMCLRIDIFKTSFFSFKSVLLLTLVLRLIMMFKNLVNIIC